MIETERITSTTLVPTMIQRMLNARRADRRRPDEPDPARLMARLRSARRCWRRRSPCCRRSG
ncbi:long-chain fatty acid--CoA ligase [Pseudonocardia sp. MCCB 268]|nr:long-chain fatty acid--CoA ligase [Pseudonocardia cytotoxica]